MSAHKTSNYQDPKRRGLLPTPPNYLTSQPPKTIGLLPTPTNFQYSGLNQSIRQNFPQTKRKNWCKYKFVKWSHHPRQQPKTALEPPLLTKQQPKTALEPPLLTRQQPKTALEPPLLTRQQTKSALEPPLLTKQQPKSALEPPAKTPGLIENPIIVKRQVENTQPENTETQNQNVPPTLNYKPTPGGLQFKWNTRS